MEIKIAFFAARRYWNDEKELQNAYHSMANQFASLATQTVLITQETDLAQSAQTDCLVIVPMSGAVQRIILQAANQAKTVIFYPAYIQGNVDDTISAAMMKNNAAPTVMDCWAVLKRTHAHVQLVMNEIELQKAVRVFHAYLAVQGATILLIGNTEPWVISNGETLKCYEKLGVTVKQIQQEEVAKEYHLTTQEDAEMFLRYFKGEERAIVEPSGEDIINSCKMAAALLRVVQRYDADGVALACFNLLEEGTTCCLGVSYLNDCTKYVAACEGDVDSAITMLCMKQLAKTKLWMANPGLHPDKTVNFSHCTAPLDLHNCGKCPYTLRSHHESGIGTSLQVEYPVEQTVTACRISNDAKQMTVQLGTTLQGVYETACRTQVYVKFDDFDAYINTALGCHQVFAFEDISHEMKSLGKELGLELL